MTDHPESRWRWRPEPWWMVVGLFAGATWGAVAGGLWLGIVFWGAGWEGSSPLWHFPIGAWFGIIFGAPTGLAAGTVLALLVGRDRPVRTARVLAAVVALLAAPLALGALVRLTTDSGLEPFSLAPLLACAGLAAAATAWWFAPKMERRPRMVSSA